jgi:hypothetical protein
LFDDDENISGSLSLVNGIKWKQWHAGIGIGLDGYDDWRFFPVFTSLTLDLSKKGGNSVFLQLNTGYSFGQYVPLNNPGFDGYKDYGGFMMNPMIGYRVKVDKYSFCVSAGHKFQKASYGYTSNSSWAPWEYETKTKLNRFIIQMSFGLR